MKSIIIKMNKGRYKLRKQVQCRKEETIIYRGCRSLSGYFTIEATLLMMIILPVMTGLIIAGFFVHDRARFQAAACETAARGSCLVIDRQQNAIVGRAASALRSGSMWAGNAYSSASASEDNVSASFGGDFHFPGFSSQYLPGNGLTCNGNWERTIYHPAKLIRKVRGVKALIDLISDE